MKVEIISDPAVRFGKPIIKGTRITAEEVLGMLENGMDFTEIEKEYGLKKPQILAVVRYFAGWIKGEQTKEYALSARR